jgi:hypothetical protein
LILKINIEEDEMIAINMMKMDKSIKSKYPRREEENENCSVLRKRFISGDNFVKKCVLKVPKHCLMHFIIMIQSFASLSTAAFCLRIGKKFYPSQARAKH